MQGLNGHTRKTMAIVSTSLAARSMIKENPVSPFPQNDRIPLMAGNWKMFKTPSEAVALAQALAVSCAPASDREVLLCPPFISLPAVRALVQGSKMKLGGQNLHWEAQ